MDLDKPILSKGLVAEAFEPMEYEAKLEPLQDVNLVNGESIVHQQFVFELVPITLDNTLLNSTGLVDLSHKALNSSVSGDQNLRETREWSGEESSTERKDMRLDVQRESESENHLSDNGNNTEGQTNEQDTTMSTSGGVCSTAETRKLDTSKPNSRKVLNKRRFVIAKKLSKQALIKHKKVRPSKKYKYLSCKICRKNFDRKNELERHCAYHHEGPCPYRCKECLTPYFSPAKFNEHFKVHNRDEKFKCNKCSASFPEWVNFKQHLSAHTKYKVHADDAKVLRRVQSDLRKKKLCKENLISKNPDSTNSLKKISNNQPSLDTVNNVDTNSTEEIIMFSEYLNREQLYQDRYCELCKTTFNKPHELSRHDAYYHKGPAPFRCKECCTPFFSKSWFDEHIKIHEGTRKYGCNKCNASYKSENRLVIHLQAHDNYEKHPDDLKMFTRHKHFKQKSEKSKSPCPLSRKNALSNGGQHKQHEENVQLQNQPIEEVNANATSLVVSNLDNDRNREAVKSSHHKIRNKNSIVIVKKLDKKELLKHKQPEPSTNNKIKKCTICGELFKKKRDLDNHFAVNHKGPCPFRCGECYMPFFSKKKLDVHSEIHKLPKRQFGCGKCSASFTLKRMLGQHLRIHGKYEKHPDDVSMLRKKRPLDKEEEDNVLTNKPSDTVHTISSSVQATVDNVICVEDTNVHEVATFSVYTDRNQLRQKQYCELCKLAFDKPCEFDRHNAREHKGLCPFMCQETEPSTNIKIKKCTICGKEFKRLGHLNMHYAYNHKGPCPFRCDECYIPCFSKKELDVHSEIHRFPKRQFRCGKCSASFMLKRMLSQHLETHDKYEKHPDDNKMLTEIQQLYGGEEHKVLTYTKSDLLHPISSSENNQTIVDNVICVEDTNVDEVATFSVYTDRNQLREKKYCESCKLAFDKPCEFDRHNAREHKGPCPFRCQECCTPFFCKPKLDEHLQVHEGSREYVCTKCNASYMFENTLAIHIQAHDKYEKHPDDFKMLDKHIAFKKNTEKLTSPCPLSKKKSDKKQTKKRKVNGNNKALSNRAKHDQQEVDVELQDIANDVSDIDVEEYNNMYDYRFRNNVGQDDSDRKPRLESKVKYIQCKYADLHGCTKKFTSMLIYEDHIAVFHTM